MYRKWVGKLWKGILLVVLGLSPVFFSPWMFDVQGAGKQSFLWMGVSLCLILWAGEALIFREKKFNWHVFLTWWLALIAVAGVSFFTMSLGARTRSVYYPWGIGSMVVVFLSWFLVLQAGKNFISKLLVFWKMVGMVVSVLSLLIILIPVSKFPINIPNASVPWLVLNGQFSLLGSVVAELIFLSVLCVVACLRLRGSYKRGEKYLHWTAVASVLLVGVLINVYRLYRAPMAMLDIVNTWVIFTETLKQKVWLGLGVGNFIEGFFRFRSNTYNLSPNWAMSFTFAPSGILQWGIETGLVGCVVFLLGALRGGVEIIRQRRWWLLAIAIVVFALPWYASSFLVLGSLLFLDDSLMKKVEVKSGNWIFGGVGIILGLTMLWFGAKVVLAEYFWKNSLIMVSRNDGNGAYTSQQKAISLMLENSDFRKGFSQTNFALAKSVLASAQGSGEKELSAENQQIVSTLLTQAVSEAKSAVALEPNISTNWENLAVLYRGMIGVVDGSFDWALQAYTQATILDIVGPNARVEVGGLYYGAGNFEMAAKSFEEAVRVKPDLANAWYNLAWANYNLALATKANPAMYSQKLNMAVGYMQQSLALVDPTSADFERANGELSTWKGELDKLNTKNPEPEREPETLKRPERIISPVVGTEERVNVDLNKLEPPKVEPTQVASQSAELN